MKLIWVISILFALALSHVNANCSADCPETEDVVWALGGGCSVFRNKCFFDKENCYRKPPLTITTKEECQKLCPDICPQIYQPVSGTYNGQVRNFGNACEKIVHSCKTGETFLD
ncbi:U-Kazal-Dg21.2 [Drosophila virilis]|uniref:Kazal-like domain-containing protein n=1 Tax=Drosophila virilis TaxID=7244 RepID=B4LY36_DROVI|nr:uncharacterized protein LOC6630697 [Drosophila virilis]EDW67924.1 uncharacterized protein Dvir_GJ24431 [Drosophila virilis]